MKPHRLHIMRDLRLRLKTGYLKAEPSEYVFMKRNPPATRWTPDVFHTVKNENVPYIRLYQKVVDRNPIYIDEKVAPGHWMYEPQALTWAKKWHELMQQGVEEELAYQQARKHVDSLENEAFLATRKIHEAIKAGGALPVADEAVSTELASWREKVRQVGGLQYLNDTEEGELNHFIHTKVLLWNEVDRERRMREPVFVELFGNFLKTLFPLTDSDVNDPRFHTRRKADWVEKLSRNFKTSEPFYVEDYIEHFKRIRNQPDIRRWSPADRSVLSTWIVSCLTLKNTVHPSDVMGLEKYLKSTRSVFFPMLVFPQRAKDFEVPTVAKIKKLLYDNGIGYKKGEEGKLFVNRFYRLPRLLFPKVTEEIETLLEAAEEEEAKESASAYKPQASAAGGAAGRRSEDEIGDEFDEDDGEDMAVDHDEEDVNSAHKEWVKRNVIVKKPCSDDFAGEFKRIPDPVGQPDDPIRRAINAKKGRTSRLDELMKSQLNYTEEVEREREEIQALRTPIEALRDTSVITDDEEWRRTFAKYYQYPTNEFEVERERYYRTRETEVPESAQNETEMKLWEDYRQRGVMVERAKLTEKFNIIDSARLRAEWERRGVWLEKFKPPPDLLSDEYTEL